MRFSYPFLASDGYPAESRAVAFSVIAVEVFFRSCLPQPHNIPVCLLLANTPSSLLTSHHPYILAPPLSIASISALDHADRRNRAGSSLRSKNSPLCGSTGPSECPEWLPIAPNVVLWFMPGPPFSGPCCCAFWR